MKENGKIQKTAQKAKYHGVNAITKILFSRIFVTAILLLVQIFVMFRLVLWVNNSAKGIIFALNILAVIFVVTIVNNNDNPAFKITWMLVLCAFPIFGVLLYLIIQFNPTRFGMKSNLKKNIRETKPYLQQDPKVLQYIEDSKMPIRGLSHYLRSRNHFPSYYNTEIDYFSNGEEKLNDLLVELRNAKDFIFLEYFIINPGRVWSEILEILIEKAKEGVEVRVMYDGFNSILKLPHRYPEKLSKYGIKVHVFSPVIPFLSSHQNYRDHRKILIIDGKIAYNGGINLADEYMNYIERFGYWKDTAVKLEGEAVKSFTAMFLQMWNIGSKKGIEDYERYLTVDATKTSCSPYCGITIPYNDDPCNDLDVAEEVYLDILNRAEHYVWIMTPYLVPENELITALCFAAGRGVDVRIIMPHIPDKKITFAIGHTFYPKLMAAGVKIYEFTPGFVHAKMFLTDDNAAVVGTINLDFRSLYQHYECATFIYKNPVIEKIKDDYLDTFEKSQLFQKEDYKKLPLLHRICGNVFHIFAPLM